jgi:AhpD family alkylhydroperoxidase
VHLCVVNNDIKKQKIQNEKFYSSNKRTSRHDQPDNFRQFTKGVGLCSKLVCNHCLFRKWALAYQNSKTNLSNKEKEAVNLVVSQANNCVYCQSAHTVIGKMNGFTDEQLLDIRKGKATDAKLNALVQLAESITKNRGNADATLVDNFYAQGYTNENLVDLILQVSDKTAMNYLHNLTKVPVDFPLAAAL